MQIAGWPVTTWTNLKPQKLTYKKPGGGERAMFESWQTICCNYVGDKDSSEKLEVRQANFLSGK